MSNVLDDPRTPAERQREAERDLQRQLRSTGFAPPRRRWPGLLALCILAAGVGGLAVSSLYDKRSTGEKLDATVQNMRAGANAVARDGALATDRAASALGDAGITAAVKTALAADPKLSAVQIDVSTEGGTVTLSGPAPDERSRERAEVLAAAPAGVNHVDNRLVVTPAADSAPR
jgi:hyperosmotically inducible periplasmic protein